MVLPDVAEIVRFVVPGAVRLFAVNVRVVLPLPGNGIESESKWEVTPAGVQQIERKILPEKPPTTVLVTVALAELP